MANVCPVCGGVMDEQGEYQSDEGDIWVEYICADCGHSEETIIDDPADK